MFQNKGKNAKVLFQNRGRLVFLLTSTEKVKSISVYGWAKIEIVAGNSFGKDYYILEIPDSSQTSDIGILRPNDITEIKVYDVSGKQLCSAKSMDEINRFGNQMLILRLYSHGRLVGTRKVKN